MRTKIFAVVGAIAALLFCSPLVAAATVSDPESKVELLTLPSVSALLQEMGAQDIQATEDGKLKQIKFTDGGQSYLFLLLGCDYKPGGCLGILMIAGLDPGATNYPLEAFNEYNQKYPFASAFKVDGSKYAVQRLAISEGGITKQNLVVNIANFAGVPKEIMKFLAGRVVAGLQQGGGETKQVGLATSQAKSFELSPTEIARIVDSVQMPTTKGFLKH